MTTAYTTNKEFNPETFARIREQMLTQDNRATAFPLFEVRDRLPVFGIDTRFDPNAREVLILNDGEGNLVIPLDELTIEKAEEILKDLEDDYDTSRENFEFYSEYDMPFGDEFGNSTLEDPAVTPQTLIYMANNHREFNIFNGETMDSMLNIMSTGMTHEVKTVATFFTEKAADRYIEENRHNLNAPYTFVSSAHRNEEMQAVMHLLLNFDEPQDHPATALAP